MTGSHVQSTPTDSHVHGAGCSHGYDTSAVLGDHAHISKLHEKTLLWAALLTLGFMGVEFVAGWLSHSLALMADALHMLTDAAALGLALFAVIWSRRHADSHRHFGYGRLQVLAAFVNSLAVFGLSALLWTRAIRRFWTPQEVESGIMLWVAILGLLVNLVVFAILHKGQKDSLNVRAAALHVLGDLISSAAVVFAALMIKQTGYSIIDPLATLAVSALIANSARKMISETMHILLEGRPSGFSPEKVETAIKDSVPEVLNVHYLHAWSLSGADVLITLHAQLDDSSARSDDEVLLAIKTILRTQFNVTHSTVQLEREACADKGDFTLSSQGG